MRRELSPSVSFDYKCRSYASDFYREEQTGAINSNDQSPKRSSVNTVTETHTRSSNFHVTMPSTIAWKHSSEVVENMRQMTARAALVNNMNSTNPPDPSMVAEANGSTQPE